MCLIKYKETVAYIQVLNVNFHLAPCQFQVITFNLKTYSQLNDTPYPGADMSISARVFEQPCSPATALAGFFPGLADIV